MCFFKVLDTTTTVPQAIFFFLNLYVNNNSNAIHAFVYFVKNVSCFSLLRKIPILVIMILESHQSGDEMFISKVWAFK